MAIAWGCRPMIRDRARWNFNGWKNPNWLHPSGILEKPHSVTCGYILCQMVSYDLSYSPKKLELTTFHLTIFMCLRVDKGYNSVVTTRISLFDFAQLFAYGPGFPAKDAVFCFLVIRNVSFPVLKMWKVHDRNWFPLWLFFFHHGLLSMPSCLKVFLK